jgi:hypothetical protein
MRLKWGRVFADTPKWIGASDMICRRLSSPYILLAALLAACFLAEVAIASPPLTAAVYRTKARRICTAAKHAATVLPQPRGGDTTGAIKYWNAEITIEETEIAALERLTPPASLASLVRRGLADKHIQVTLTKRAVAKVKSGTPLIQAALLIATAPNDSHVWANVGLSVCVY